MITAISVCRQPAGRTFAGLESVELAGRVFSSAADVQAAWFDAVQLASTPWAFFIDDDDDLPEGYEGVLKQCIAGCEESGARIAYTDELVITPEGEQNPTKRGPYSRDRHLANPGLMHHLVLFQTKAARDAIASIDRGHFWPEMQLYWSIARHGGAFYLPEVGYHWRLREGSMRTKWFTTLGIARSTLWCKGRP